MKFLKGTFAILGLVGLLGGAGYLLFYIQLNRMNSLVQVANANKSGNLIANPMPLIWIGAAIVAVAGLLLGLGIAMPKKTASGYRHEALDEQAARRESEVRNRAQAHAKAEEQH
ncbi:MAG: hypothetical protein ACRCWS_03880 [Propionibacteriaceae bacterium]